MGIEMGKYYLSYLGDNNLGPIIYRVSHSGTQTIIHCYAPNTGTYYGSNLPSFISLEYVHNANEITTFETTPTLSSLAQTIKDLQSRIAALEAK